MNHPPVEILMQHALGIDSGEGDHISACESCAIEVEDLSSIKRSATTLELPGTLSGWVAQLDRDRAAAIEYMSSASPREIRSAMRLEGVLASAGGRQAVIERIPAIRRTDPSLAFEIARELAALLAPGAIEDGAIGAELHADALRETAACARVLGRYADAIELLSEAEGWANAVPSGEYLQARIWYERAGIDVAREGSETREWAAKAADVFVRFGDARRYHRSKYLVAAAHFNDRNYGDAISELDELLPRLSEDRDIETESIAWALLGQALTKENRLGEAAGALRRALAAFEQLGLPMDAIRASWGLGRIDMKLGNLDESRNRLIEARHQFHDLGLAEEAALVGLDLTECLLLVDDAEAASTICRESLEVLSATYAGREQQRALAYLREITANGLKPSQVYAVSSYLLESANDPGRRFFEPETETSPN